MLLETQSLPIPRLSIAALTRLFEQWVAKSWLRTLDAEFPLQLLPLAPQTPPLVLLLTAWVSYQYGRGHTCLDLPTLLSRPDTLLGLPSSTDSSAGASPRAAHLLAGIDLAGLERPLLESGWVSQASSAAVTPLVLHDHRLYLRRLWLAEQCVAQAISQRLQQPVSTPAGLADHLDRLFDSPPDPALPDWQRLACALAVQRPFCIITGGPGTGKTTTVVRLLALLQQTRPQAAPLRITLAAPTGKAAARLSESIGERMQSLPAPYQQDLHNQAQTLHKLLGAQSLHRSFRYHARNPLATDVLVVDEASMIDLELMAAIFDALPLQSRLILLGDQDQLASVEAGSVLADLCRGSSDGQYRPPTLTLLTPYTHCDLTPWQGAGTDANQATIRLRHSRRFDARSGIGQLAEAVKAGDMAARTLFATQPDLHWIKPVTADDAAMSRLFVDGYRPYLEAVGQRPAQEPEAVDRWAGQLLKTYSDFQVLCAVRQGPWGVTQINARIEQDLLRSGCLRVSPHWYAGRPVMVQRNNYELGLMNGDIGLCLWHPHRRELRVAFNVGPNQIKWVHPNRLGEVETVFAMTVHKSQGSEFKHCVLVLPDQHSPLLTRELIYTGITRAVSRFTLIASQESVIKQAISQPIERGSGL